MIVYGDAVLSVALPAQADRLPRMYNCSKCPGYCCSYPLIALTKRDVERLAKHFSSLGHAARNMK